MLRAAVDEMRMTTVVALLQPPPEVFEQFDRVILMREGTIIYHGVLTASHSVSSSLPALLYGVAGLVHLQARGRC